VPSAGKKQVVESAGKLAVGHHGSSNKTFTVVIYKSLAIVFRP